MKYFSDTFKRHFSQESDITTKQKCTNLIYTANASFYFNHSYPTSEKQNNVKELGVKKRGTEEGSCEQIGLDEVFRNLQNLELYCYQMIWKCYWKDSRKHENFEMFESIVTDPLSTKSRSFRKIVKKRGIFQKKIGWKEGGDFRAFCKTVLKFGFYLVILLNLRQLESSTMHLHAREQLTYFTRNLSSAVQEPFLDGQLLDFLSSPINTH